MLAVCLSGGQHVYPIQVDAATKPITTASASAALRTLMARSRLLAVTAARAQACVATAIDHDRHFIQRLGAVVDATRDALPYV